MSEMYFSVDVESDGPIPGPNSLLSIGCAAYLPDKTLVDTFSVNLDFLPGAKGDPDTMAWWAKNQSAWEACRENTKNPEVALPEFVQWVKQLAGKANKASPVCVCYPAGYDFTFLYWYMIKFAGKSPFSFSAIDAKTYAMAMLKKGYRECTKRAFPKTWFDAHKHTHVAVEDAIEQGAMFINMLNDNLSR